MLTSSHTRSETYAVVCTGALCVNPQIRRKLAAHYDSSTEPGVCVPQFMENNRHHYPQADPQAALAAIREQGACTSVDCC
jgi:hypothetical protein